MVRLLVGKIIVAMLNFNELKNELTRGITALGMPIDENKITGLLNYMNLLLKWNKVYSLTAITLPSEVIKYHLLDGLTLVKYINQIKIL